MCASIVRNIYMRNDIWNTRVRKHNLRGSENNNEHENFGNLIELVLVVGD